MTTASVTVIKMALVTVVQGYGGDARQQQCRWQAMAFAKSQEMLSGAMLNEW